MKRNIKFFTIVISLLLLSSIILTGCMYVIAADNGEMKPYDLNGQKENSDSSGGNIVEDAPTAQMPLHGQFSEYLHKDGNAVTVFSEEQYAQLKAVRERNKRNPLTYEEILFLVSDSINMYFAYDEIRLTNANVDGVLPLTLTFSAIQSSSSCIIKPYHGDFSEFEIYADALHRYEHMLQEIYAIIYYRIYMHDAGFTAITRSFDEVIAPSERSEFYEEYKHLSSIWLTNIYQMLAIDGSTVGGIENGDKLASEFQKVVEWEMEISTNHVDPNKKVQSLDAPILCTETWHNERTPLEHQFYIYESSGTVQIVYPTKELTAMKPQQSVTYQAKDGYGTFKPMFNINYVTGRFAMSANEFLSFAITGKFSESDGVLKMYPSNAGDEGAYSYVLHEKDGSWVYSAKDSKPIELAGFDWHKDIVFEKVHEGVSTPQNPEPPTNDKTEPDTDEEQWAYLKYDANSNYCSLMSSEGFTVIEEGSYVKEDDKLVFMFKTANGVYTYYFNYCGDNLYTYAKGQSNPAPEYGFEDEMEFVLTAFDGGSCFLEVKED